MKFLIKVLALKNVLCLVIISLFLSSCSGGSATISPEEKRNNFDLCKIEWHKEHNSSPSSPTFEKWASEACAHYLE